MTTIRVDPFDPNSITEAVRQLREYKKWLLAKEKELRERLAFLGAVVAKITFTQAIYNGVKDVTVDIEDSGNTAVIYAKGKSVAFIEFGSGAKYGDGHPMNGELGTGPGTYPEGKGHWDDPEGWYFAHGQHTFGNPPAMAMIRSRDEMAARLTAVVREVFK